MGTLQYVSPEALSGELVSEQADVYSMATITYYLLSGRHPYAGRSPRELFQQLLSQPPLPLSQAVKGLKIPPGVEAAVMKGLARQPADRQPTVTEFAADLEAGLGGGGSGGAPEPRSGFFSAIKNFVGKRK